MTHRGRFLPLSRTMSFLRDISRILCFYLWALVLGVRGRKEWELQTTTELSTTMTEWGAARDPRRDGGGLLANNSILPPTSPRWRRTHCTVGTYVYLPYTEQAASPRTAETHGKARMRRARAVAYKTQSPLSSRARLRRPGCRETDQWSGLRRRSIEAEPTLENHKAGAILILH